MEQIAKIKEKNMLYMDELPIIVDLVAKECDKKLDGVWGNIDEFWEYCYDKKNAWSTFYWWFEYEINVNIYI